MMLGIGQILMTLAGNLDFLTPSLKITVKHLTIGLEEFETHENLLSPDGSLTHLTNLGIYVVKDGLITRQHQPCASLARVRIRTRRVLYFSFLYFTLCTFFGV